MLFFICFVKVSSTSKKCSLTRRNNLVNNENSNVKTIDWFLYDGGTLVVNGLMCQVDTWKILKFLKHVLILNEKARP